MRKGPKIFGKVAELARRNAFNITWNLKTKRVFTPFCKGLGLYCNRFWGYGALGRHKCNRSDRSHSIKEIEIVKGKISILEPFFPTYLIGKCIDQREREESALGVCA